MPLVVRKYGGSSVATIEKISFVAAQIKALHDEGNKIICVVSAMGSTTDELLKLAKEISNSPDSRELDMLLSIGERKSISLMALALAALDVPTVSYTGSQVGIITDNKHGKAQILEIKTDRIKTALEEGKVVVVAGYQGVSTEKEITTLGRGGTDTTAVALAAALAADRCELMKDVDGLFNVPPKLLKDCNLRAEISHADMIEIAKSGAELVAKPALELAQVEKIKLGIGNTKTNYVGTIVVDKALKQEEEVQVVYTKCFYSTRNYEPNDANYLQAYSLSSQQINIDLDPDLSNKNAILLSLFNAKKEQLKFLEKMSAIFTFKENKKDVFLFDLSLEAELKKTINKITKLV